MVLHQKMKFILTNNLDMMDTTVFFLIAHNGKYMRSYWSSMQ